MSQDGNEFDPEDLLSEFDEDIQIRSLDEYNVEDLDFKTDSIRYPSEKSIDSIHEDIINSDEDASSGVLNSGQIDYALNCVEHGHFGKVPETIHEKAFTLMRLLAANHAYADGNKRTALNTVWTFYAINGYYFNYGEEIKAILKLLAVKEEMVDQNEAISYFGDIALDEDDPEAPTQFVKMTHLFSWYEDIKNGLVDYLQNVDGNSTIESGKSIGETMAELFAVVSEIEEFRRRNSEDLPEETIQFIEEIYKETKELHGMMEGIAEIMISSETSEEFRQKMEENDFS